MKNSMDIYLAIIQTYLAISFTLFIIYLWKVKNEAYDIKKDNEKWKNEVREKFNSLRKLHFRKK